MSRLLIMLFLTTLFSCTTRDRAAERARDIYDASMKVHDQVMPRMDELYRQQQRLKSMLVDLKKDSIQNEDKIRLIRTSIQSLEDAGEGMMHWMHHVKVPPDKSNDPMQSDESQTAGPEEQQIQLHAIEAVRDAMEKSIQEAEAIQQ